MLGGAIDPFRETEPVSGPNDKTNVSFLGTFSFLGTIALTVLRRLFFALFALHCVAEA